jgi:hypothetical protein
VRLFENVLILIDSTFDEDLGGRVAVVRDVVGDTVNAVLLDSYDSVRIPLNFVSVVAPGRRDRATIIRGPSVGNTGVLIGAAPPDGILKMDDTSEIKIVKLENLAKSQAADSMVLNFDE